MKKSSSWWSHKHSLCMLSSTNGEKQEAFEKQTGETRFCVHAKMRIPSLLFSLLQLTASSVQFRKREKEQATRVPASLAWHAALPSCCVNYESRACVRILPVLFLLPKSETSQSTLTTRSVVWFYRCYPWYFNSMLHRITRFTLRLCNCARSDCVKFNRFVFRRHTFRIKQCWNLFCRHTFRQDFTLFLNCVCLTQSCGSTREGRSHRCQLADSRDLLSD